MKRLDEPVELIIKTKCPKKWKILDTETGQSYEATGKTKLYEMWKPCKDIIKVDYNVKKRVRKTRNQE